MAKVHYCLMGEKGKKVFTRADTIRAAFWGNAYAGSVGQLTEPLADKIGGRLADAGLL